MYEFTKLQLEKDEFFNLVFMGAPSWWENEEEYPPCTIKKRENVTFA